MRVWLPVLMVLALAGCGGNDPEPDQTPTSAATTPGGVAQVRGTVDPLAITRFTCRQDDAGRWRVKGTLTNTAKSTRDYRVTVFIGQQTGPARTVDLDRVKGGASVPFTAQPVVAAPDGPCRLQALVRL